MLIQDKILDKLREEPRLFAEILKRLNSSELFRVQPYTLSRRLERKSEAVKNNAIIADFFREIGYKDNEIFESYSR